MNTETNLLRFHAFTLSLEVIRSLRPLVSRIQSHDGPLATQLRKAASSVSLNIAEGRGRAGRDRTYHWRVAMGSANEACACLYTAHAWGYLAERDIAEALDLLDRALATLWRMTHRG